MKCLSEYTKTENNQRPYFQNATLTWYTSNPNFTACFEKTVLLWIPCLFIWLFAGVDIYFMTNSKKRNIPSNWINTSKLVMNGILLILVFVDLLTSFNNSSKVVIYDVDIYSPIIKAITLVSINYIVNYWFKCNNIFYLGIWELLII